MKTFFYNNNNKNNVNNASKRIHFLRGKNKYETNYNFQVKYLLNSIILLFSELNKANCLQIDF